MPRAAPALAALVLAALPCLPAGAQTPPGAAPPQIPSPAHADPMTYAVDGRQYVVVAAGGDALVNPEAIDDYLLAYALPDGYLKRQPQAGAAALDSGPASVP